MKALNLFLEDVYGECRIVDDGVIPGDVVYECPQYRMEMRGFSAPQGTWVGICGTDIVRTNDGFRVLEDNLRVPSGVSYMLANRKSAKASLRRLYRSSKVKEVEHYGRALLETLRELAPNGRATMSDWFFQMVFVATAASIVSGAIAERIKMWSFFLFTLLLTALIYPIVGAWTWGGGWLTELGFKDFAGSTIVHSTGGWAALAGVLVVGPRLGKYRRDGSIQPTPPSNVLVVTLGVFILWLGWFGFNGGSQLALGSAKEAVGMSHVHTNTNLAAADGVMTAIAVSRPIIGRMDLFAGLNGAIAGLVSITAGPDIVDHHWAVVIGAVGGVICTAGIKLLDKIKLDDVVGAMPAHLFAGIWGTLAVCIAAGGQFHIQLLGVVVIGVFVFSISGLLWRVLDMTLGLRVSRDAERLGQDVAELGIEVLSSAYPEFVLMPEELDEED